MKTLGREILAVGAVIADLVCRVPRLPASGEGVVANEVRAAVGGCAFNAANVLRQLGAPYKLFAPLGQGVFAGFVERDLAARGMTALRVPDGRGNDGAVYDNSGCVCFVEPGGERTMLTLPGIDRHFDASWFEAVDAARFSCGFASGYEVEGPGGDAIVGFFEAHPEILLYYAPGPRVAHVDPQRTARINALRPVWHLNDLEALTYTGRSSLEEAGFALAAECGNAVVVTEGSRGAHLFEPAGEEGGACRVEASAARDVRGAEADAARRAETRDVPGAEAHDVPGSEARGTREAEARDVPGAEASGTDARHLFVPTEPVDVADTIGAGDAHLGALVAARNAGRSWEEALALANRVAGAVCQVSGGALDDESFRRLGALPHAAGEGAR